MAQDIRQTAVKRDYMNNKHQPNPKNYDCLISYSVKTGINVYFDSFLAIFTQHYPLQGAKTW